ncbi:MAG TPA: TauD/TfdA family dioxygenase [Pseudonocardiaceae bacterium]|nr:TauD/TfdA family dioxygenase [Pseudonocardiaceae bacterium]
MLWHGRDGTSNPQRAFHLWSSDGAVILTTHRTDVSGMLAGAREVFGPRILVHQTPATVADSAIPVLDSYYTAVTRTVNGNAGVAVELHIDGYLPFGDHYPDLVFLHCQRQAAGGGESFIVDGQRLVDAITSNPAQRALSRFLWDIKLEQSRSDGGNPAGDRHTRPQPTARGVADLCWTPHRAPPPTPTSRR